MSSDENENDFFKNISKRNADKITCMIKHKAKKAKLSMKCIKTFVKTFQVDQHDESNHDNSSESSEFSDNNLDGKIYFMNILFKVGKKNKFGALLKKVSF